MKKTDTLIVGQGLAGSLVAYMLYKRKVPFMVIDPGEANTSSRVAAGMFTPISGRRKTIQAGVIQQISFAIELYREIEQLLNVKFLHLKNIYQVYVSEEERNEWNEKLKKDDFAQYVVTPVVPLTGIKQTHGAIAITHSGWVDCVLFINSVAQWLTQNNAFTKAAFSYTDLQIADDFLSYQGIEYNNIIFCEGYQAMDSPFFDSGNIIPCKGDVLTIRHTGTNEDNIVKKNGVYLVPAGDHLSRAGATYHWHNRNPQPDKEDQLILEKQLDALLEDGYTTIGHQSGIRPTTKNREVIAKQHPQYAGMFMLNGLGTKGVLQGPWWASYITELCAASR